ncbi:MAG TPA: DUF1731 domain-containing protein [Bdellovibrionales bacterium]|nr:DUF1731 domain-containing protein [Bdellovibrionales bacterium]
MRVLITGATGLVGNALGQRLVREGHEVVALARTGDKARPCLSFPSRIYQWSGSEAVPAAALDNVDAIVHLAGENVAAQRWTADRKKRLIRSRVDTAAGLSEAGALADLCGKWEAAADRVPAERTVKLRFGIVLSGGGGFLDQVVPLFQRLGASRLGDGSQWFSWIHIDDLTALLMRALTDPSMGGAYNAVAPWPVTNAEQTAELAKAIQAYLVPPVPSLALRLAYGELATALLSSQRVRSERLDGFKFRYLHFEDALKDLFPAWEVGELQIKREQWVPAGTDQIWEFFSSEKNLERITPPFLGFHVRAMNTEKIKEGTEIDYTLNLHGLPIAWRSKISEWKEKTHFADTQLQGPYKKWFHRHDFEPLAGGVLLKDHVRFVFPPGLAGRLVAGGKVSGDVKKIFDYRAKIIDGIFCPR